LRNVNARKILNFTYLHLTFYDFDIFKHSGLHKGAHHTSEIFELIFLLASSLCCTGKNQLCCCCGMCRF